MKTNSISDTYNKIVDIRQELLNQINEILNLLKDFFYEDNKKNIIKNNDTLQKLQESCFSFKEKVNDILEKNLTKRKIKNINYSEFFSEIRHDLRNSVSSMQGYTEMMLEEFQEIKSDQLTKKTLEILALVLKTLSTINKINITYFQPEKSSKSILLSAEQTKIPVDLNTITSREYINNPEYIKFKNEIKILIVDDKQENREILGHYLKRIGYKNIANAENGLQALTMLEEQYFDIVLLDIDMPGINGIDVLLRIKEDMFHRQIMVLMISAADTMKNILICIRLGAEDFLPKPFNTDLLRVRMGACVEKKWFLNYEALYRTQLETEKNRYENLLCSIFPSAIVKELMDTSEIRAKSYHNVAVLFTDIVDFTHYCDIHPLPEIIKNIQDFAEKCENVAIQFNLQKIKTIGDGFLATAGMLTTNTNPVLDCINCAQELIKQSQTLDAKWQLRAGIAYGTVIGGVVGHRQYLFDIWGDTVNTAARLLTVIKPNQISLTQSAWEEVKNKCSSYSLGLIELKGKAPLEIFVLNENKHNT